MNKEDRKLYHQEYYRKNKEKLDGKTVEWQKNNKEKLAAWYKIYYLKNKEKVKTMSKEWQENNRKKVNAYRTAWRKTEKYKEYLIKNKEKISLRNAKWYQDHGQEYREEHKRRCREHYLKNKVQRIEKQKIYEKNHRKEIQASRTERRKTNLQFRLSTTLRSRIVSAVRGNLKGKRKAGSAVRDLGCTVSELKLYLEERFQEGMSWDNWAFRGWHIDHDIPLAFFDLTNRQQFLQAVHYTNLQPMWWKENMEKRKNLGTFLANRLLDK